MAYFTGQTALLGDIVKHQHRTQGTPVTVTDGGGRVFDGMALISTIDQYRLAFQIDYPMLRQASRRPRR
jgi:hypothetical protein